MTRTAEAAARTHVGLVRRRNEDAAYAGQWLFAVADGLGGHVAGDIASTTVIEALRPYDRQIAPTDLADFLGEAIRVASQALHRKVETDPALMGMGTTLVAMLQSGTAAVLANVGDSRAYLLRNAEITQITEDHNYGNLVADAASVPNLPERLARFLDGRAGGRSPDLTPMDLRTGDRILLCSDGLSGPVPHELIREAMSTTSDPGECTDRLIALAIDHGGPDNITVITIDVGVRR